MRKNRHVFILFPILYSLIILCGCMQSAPKAAESPDHSAQPTAAAEDAAEAENTPTSEYAVLFDDVMPIPDKTYEPCRYVGNRRTMVFHDPDCPAAAQIKEENRVEFHDARAIVMEHQYRPCERCNP